jgi:hypothetical protein
MAIPNIFGKDYVEVAQNLGAVGVRHFKSNAEIFNPGNHKNPEEKKRR